MTRGIRILEGYIDSITFLGVYPKPPLHEILNLDPIHVCWVKQLKEFWAITIAEIHENLTLSLNGMNYYQHLTVDLAKNKNIVINLKDEEMDTELTVANSVYIKAIYIFLIKARVLELRGLRLKGRLLK